MEASEDRRNTHKNKEKKMTLKHESHKKSLLRIISRQSRKKINPERRSKHRKPQKKLVRHVVSACAGVTLSYEMKPQPYSLVTHYIHKQV